jgi:hypothetical protein
MTSGRWRRTERIETEVGRGRASATSMLDDLERELGLA